MAYGNTFRSPSSAYGGSVSPNNKPIRNGLFEVMKRLRTAHLKSHTKLVAAFIADALGREGDKQVCFLSLRTLAARTDLCERTVSKALRELRQWKPPIFAMHLGGVTRNHRHRCYRFELIDDPQGFCPAAPPVVGRSPGAIPQHQPPKGK